MFTTSNLLGQADVYNLIAAYSRSRLMMLIDIEGALIYKITFIFQYHDLHWCDVLNFF